VSAGTLQAKTPTITGAGRGTGPALAWTRGRGNACCAAGCLQYPLRVPAAQRGTGRGWPFASMAT